MALEWLAAALIECHSRKVADGVLSGGESKPEGPGTPFR